MWDAPRNAWGQWDYIDLSAGKDALTDSIQVYAPPVPNAYLISVPERICVRVRVRRHGEVCERNRDPGRTRILAGGLSL